MYLTTTRENSQPALSVDRQEKPRQNPVFVRVSKRNSKLAHLIKDNINSSLVFSSETDFIIVLRDSGDGGCDLYIDHQLIVSLGVEQPDLTHFYPIEEEPVSDIWYEAKTLSSEDIEDVGELTPKMWDALVRHLAPYYDIDQIDRSAAFNTKRDIYNHVAALGEQLIADGHSVLGLAGKRPVAGQNSNINKNKFAAANNVIDWRKHVNSRATGKVDGVGLATGQGRYIVIDLDTGPDGQPVGYESLLEVLGVDVLPDCPIVRTPSGGLHIYMEDIEGVTVSAGRIGAKIDIRGTGGFVVAAGTCSQKRGAFYHWIPNHSIYEKPLGVWSDRLLFATMFNEHDKRALQQVGVNSHADLVDIPHSGWKSHTDKKLADHKDSPEQKKLHEQRNKRLKSLTVKQATDINKLAAIELSNLVADLVDTSLEEGHGKNHKLFMAARRCGALLSHDFTSKKLEETEVIEALVSATSRWVNHDLYSRNATIESGVRAGRADIANGDTAEIDEKVDKCLGIFDRVSEHPFKRGNNIRETQTLDEARSTLYQRVDVFFDEARFFDEKEKIRLLKDKHNLTNIPPFIMQQVDVGAGKTKVLIDRVIQELPFMQSEDKAIIYSVPTHKLAEEVRQRFIQAGALEDDVAVYHGRSAPSPEKEDEQACLRSSEADLISKNGGSVSELLCKDCPFADICFWQKQKKVKPLVWIIPHALLSVDASPKSADNVLPSNPYAVLIDESYAHSHVVPAKRESRVKQIFGPKGDEVEINQPDPYRLLAEHRQLGCPLIYQRQEKYETKSYWHLELSSRFEELRAKLDRLVTICKDSYVTKAALDQVGLSHRDLEEAYGLERTAARQAREMEGDSWSDGYASSIEGWYLSHCHYWHNLWSALSHIAKEPEWDEIPDLIGDVGAVYCHSNGDLTIGYIKPLANRWYRSPVFHVDATPVDDKLAEAVGTFRYTRLNPIAITTPNQHVTAIVGTATGKKHVEKKAKVFGASIAADMFKHGTDPKKTLIISHKTCGEALKQSLPEGVTVKWFGGIRGLDAYGDYEALYIVGGPNPNEDQISGHCETMNRCELVGENGFKQSQQLELRNGRIDDSSGLSYSKLHSVYVPAHSAPKAREYVAEVREAEMIQAVGRLRGINRTKDNKARIVIIGDYVLPIEYDSIEEFTAWASTPFDVMECAGVTPESYRTAYQFYPYLWKSEAACGHDYRLNPESKAMRDPLYSILIYSPRIHFDSGIVKAKAYVSDHVDQDNLPELVSDLSGGRYAVQLDRDPKVEEFMDRFGFISLSPAHNHMLASDLFPKKESSKGELKKLQPKEGEVVVEYQRAGARTRKVKAIVFAPDEETGLAIVAAHLSITG